jgi:HEPN domain-containing protein
MPEYNLLFAERLIDAADCLVEQDKPGVVQAVLYLSYVAAEITLKVLLEKAGWSVKHLTRRGHKLADLLKDICACEVQDSSRSIWRSAASLCSVTVDSQYSDATVGKLLQAETQGASTYPNQIRYGEDLHHYHPLLMLGAARKALEWAKNHEQTIRRKKT